VALLTVTPVSWTEDLRNPQRQSTSAVVHTDTTQHNIDTVDR